MFVSLWTRDKGTNPSQASNALHPSKYLDYYALIPPCASAALSTDGGRWPPAPRAVVPWTRRNASGKQASGTVSASRSRTSLAVLLCPVPAALVGAATANVNQPCLRLRRVRTAQYTANTQPVLIRRPWFTFTVPSSHHQPHALAGRFQRADTPRHAKTGRADGRRRKYTGHASRHPRSPRRPRAFAALGGGRVSGAHPRVRGGRGRTHPAPNYYRRQAGNIFRTGFGLLL